MEKRTLVLLAAVFQAVALLFIAAKYWYVDYSGRTVLVRAYGYDPLDPMRGEYAAISYGPLAVWTGATDFERNSGREVYVVPELTSSGEFVSVRSVLAKRPNEFSIRAKIVSDSFEKPVYSFAPAEGAPPSFSGTFANVEEWVVKMSESPLVEPGRETDVPYTKFRAGSGAIAGVTLTGSVFALYSDLAECKDSLRYSHYQDAFGSGSEMDQKIAMAIPTDYPGFQEAVANKCAAFPKIVITDVKVSRALRLDYLADRLFVSERTGAAVEKLLRERVSYAEWRVSSLGTVVRSIRSGDVVIR